MTGSGSGTVRPGDRPESAGPADRRRNRPTQPFSRLPTRTVRRHHHPGTSGPSSSSARCWCCVPCWRPSSFSPSAETTARLLRPRRPPPLDRRLHRRLQPPHRSRPPRHRRHLRPLPPHPTTPPPTTAAPTVVSPGLYECTQAGTQFGSISFVGNGYTTSNGGSGTYRYAALTGDLTFTGADLGDFQGSYDPAGPSMVLTSASGVVLRCAQ